MAPGVDDGSVYSTAQALIGEGAIVRLVGPHVGLLRAASGEQIDADASLTNSPSVVFDAVVVPDGAEAIDALCKNGLALEYVRDAFRHAKTMMAIGEGRRLLQQAGIPLAQPDKGLILAADTGSTADFIKAVGQHRHPERETVPPLV